MSDPNQIQEPLVATDPAPAPQVDPVAEPTPATEGTPAPEATPSPPPALEPNPDPAPTVKPEPAKDETSEKKPEDELSGYKMRVLNAEARAAAIAAGIPANRLDATLKLAELGGIDPDEDGAAAKIEAAISAVLETLPELKGAAGTGSLGNHARQTQSAEDKARDEFRRGLNL